MVVAMRMPVGRAARAGTDDEQWGKVSGESEESVDARGRHVITLFTLRMKVKCTCARNTQGHRTCFEYCGGNDELE